MKRPLLGGVAVTLLLLPLAGCIAVKGTMPPAPPATATANHTTVETTLANGMKVIVREDHRAPIVVSQVWYKVGSGYEPSGITGVSHVLEHMMFKGTTRHPAGEFSRLIAEQGGRENAFTGSDYTAYFQSLERSRLPIALELEADRMRNLTLPPEEFAKEVKVVMEERRMRTEDKPSALTYEQFRATAFLTGPYHSPVIGWMDDLEHLTVDHLRDWYGRWYAPDNATLVVAGDVTASEVFALAEQHFGPLQPSGVTPLREWLDTPQLGERRITVRAPAELPVLMLGYKVPSLRTAAEPDEAYALEMLAHVLDGGDSARFSRELVRGTQVAASASAGYDLTARHHTLFTLDALPGQGKSIGDIEQALQEQVARVQAELVAQTELDRIKAQVIAGKVYELDSVFYQGMQIGTLETIGLDWRVADEYLARIEAVTPEQIRAVARKYLVNDQRTVATLEPLPLDTHTTAKEATHGSH